MTPPPPDDAAANELTARRDLAAARTAGDSRRAVLLEALLSSGGSLVVYRPERDHYAVQLGGLADAHHVAVLVPGVGTDIDLRSQWLPSAANLYAAAESTTVILWKGYDEPPDLVVAVERTVVCDDGVRRAAARLAAFVRALPLARHQTVTVVAHSFGSVVAGAALAHHDLPCDAVVVAGSPGMTVDDLRQLHVDDAHLFTEEAPGDPVAGLGAFGAEPTSPLFGGTRMRTNAPGHPTVSTHSEYFTPGSESLENIVHVVTSHYDEVTVQSASLAESAGGLVAWALRLPTLPVGVVARHYRGPGFRVLVDTRRLADLAANEAGSAMCEGLDAAGRAVSWLARHAVAGADAGTADRADPVTGTGSAPAPDDGRPAPG